MNALPVKGGASKHCSPHMILKRKLLDHGRDFKYPLGDCGTAGSHTDNTMKGRAVEAIHLRPLDKDQGGHECMNLITGKRMTCGRFECLMTAQTAMDQVERIAHKQNAMSFEITNISET